mmetsp:Transcript_55714/g.124379  ORF Transcript_55714/g.124379 Transcript_55714/m.124379 type:complete len:106 (-) Transcript_55714:39-356(-)
MYVMMSIPMWGCHPTGNLSGLVSTPELTDGPNSSHIRNGSASFSEIAAGKGCITENLGSPVGCVTCAALTSITRIIPSLEAFCTTPDEAPDMQAANIFGSQLPQM